MNGPYTSVDTKNYKKLIEGLCKTKVTEVLTLEFMQTHHIAFNEKVVIFDGKDLDAVLFGSVSVKPNSNNYRFYYLKKFK